MHKRSLTLYAGLVPALCVWCYLYYPAWRNVAALRDAPGISIYLAVFIIALLLIVQLAMSLSGTERIRTGASNATADNGRDQHSPRWPALAVGALVVVFFLAQLQFINLPVLSGPDESGHVFRKLRQWHLFVRDGSLYPAVAFALACLASVLCCACFAIPIRNVSRRQLIAHMMLVLALFLVLVGLTEAIKATGRGWGTDFRFPPLRNIAIQPAIVLLGASEIAVRIVSTILGALTAMVVYKILSNEQQPVAGFVAAAICLTCPTFFMYGHLDYRDIGGAFFVALFVYFLLKYLRTWNPIYLSISCYAVAAGYLERRPVAIVLLICGLIVLAELFWTWQKRREHVETNPISIVRLLLSRGLFLFSTVLAVAPWIYITRNSRPYVFHPENFLELKFLVAYPKVLTSMLVWPVLIMLIAGFIIMIIKRNRSGIVAFLVCIAFYVLFTGDAPKWIPQRRFVISFLPCIAIVGALSVTWFVTTRTRTIFAMLSLVPMLVGVAGWTADSHPLMLDKRARTPQSLPRYPFDKLIGSVVNEGLNQPRFCFPMRGTQSSIHVYWQKLYPDNRLRIIKPAKKDRKLKPTLESVQAMCTEDNTDYVILMMRKFGSKPFTPYRMSGITDAQVQANSINGFDVVYVHQNGNHKLVAMKPQ